MDVLSIFLLLLIASGLANPVTDDRVRRRVAQEHTGGYGIGGGKPANIKKYPYNAPIIYNALNYLVGGGAIMNKNWIVCSAYEIHYYAASEISIRVGSNNYASGGQLLNVSKIILHEKFDIGYPYDVAVVKTKTAIKLNKLAKPIKLVKATPKSGSEAQVTGFGDSEVMSPNAGDLQVATVQVKTQSECQKSHPTAGDTCICADAKGVGPCGNDIGDPLVKNKQLLGWFLGGDICNLFGDLDLYANAAELGPWVIDTIKKNSNDDEMEGIDDDVFYRSFDGDDE